MPDFAQTTINARRFAYQNISLQKGKNAWWHTVRVANNARYIASEEGADLFVVELASLLHDISGKQNHETHSSNIAQAWMMQNGVEQETSEHVQSIIENIAFLGAGVPTPMRTLEGGCVQDADRLDDLGAIGIARAFADLSQQGREIFHPQVSPTLHETPQDFQKHQGTIINHFYEKLLLLKDRINTTTARRLAKERHDFTEEFLRKFFTEWKGEDYHTTVSRQWPQESELGIEEKK